MATQISSLVNPETWQQARAQLERVKPQLDQADRRLREALRERPIMTLLMAAFAGHLLGRVFARR